MPIRDEDLPGPLQRSPAKAKRTYKKALESAEETYGPGQRAARTAWSAVKHSFQKVGDHWEPKDEKGPSDPQAAKRGRAARRGGGKTYGGVDVRGNTKTELYEQAKQLGVEGRSNMTKEQLADALARESRRRDARRRRGS